MQTRFRAQNTFWCSKLLCSAFIDWQWATISVLRVNIESYTELVSNRTGTSWIWKSRWTDRFWRKLNELHFYVVKKIQIFNKNIDSVNIINSIFIHYVIFFIRLERAEPCLMSAVNPPFNNITWIDKESQVIMTKSGSLAVDSFVTFIHIDANLDFRVFLIDTNLELNHNERWNQLKETLRQ